jgi:alkanesulfonate monooxygenase SsuD/methylene tetrahydromethanopterin reductase-like flavin-dependent oxidoreductase (luciferase family)
MTSMIFGIMSFCVSPYDELAQRFRDAESLGFSSAWVDDDIYTPNYSEFDSWTLLPALARDTSRIRLGTLVAVPTYRHPSILAAQVMTADHLSGGRIQLGFGAGGPPNNYGAFGLDDWSPQERAGHFEEQTEILDKLLRGELVNYQGRHYQIRNAQLTSPVQRPRPPLILAAHGERGLRLTARFADVWNSLGGQPYRIAWDPAKRVSFETAVDNTRRLSEQLDEYCVEIGREPGTLRRSIINYRPVFDPLASLDAFDEYVGRYGEIGVSEIIFYWPPLDNVFPSAGGGATAGAPFTDAEPITAAQQSMFEKIATERILPG